MSELSEAVAQLENSYRELNQYIEHSCMFNKTDSPDGDVCTCGKRAAVIGVNMVVIRLRDIARRGAEAK